MSRSAYVTDLKTLHSECTANYLRLTRLVGELGEGEMREVIETPRMRVHLYHDVRMAEVTDFQRQRHFHGRYRYPNARMHQPDEKLQLNRFLGEWLEHGLSHGHFLDLPQLP